MEDLLTGVEAAAGLAVYGATAVDSCPAASVRRALVAAGVPGSLAAKDPTLWGSRAEPVAKSRLGWLDAYRPSRELLPLIAELRAELVDLDNVVLAGMGGSSLAAEVIARTLGVCLTVLDTTDPHQVRATMFGHSAAGRCGPSRSGGDPATCTPPGSTTRAVHRSARSCRSPAPSSATWRCRAGRTASVSCRPPRRRATGRL